MNFKNYIKGQKFREKMLEEKKKQEKKESTSIDTCFGKQTKTVWKEEKDPRCL